MERHLEQGLEQDVGAEIEVVGEGDFAFALAQAFENALDMGLVQAQPRLGKAPGEAAQQARHHDGREGDEAAEVELAREPAAEIESRQPQLVGMGEEPAGLAQQLPAGRRRRQALGVVAHEQLKAQAPLELRQRSRDRRLRDPEAARGTGDAALFRRGDEIGEMAEGEHE